MAFVKADEPARTGCALTLGLFASLVAAFWLIPGVDLPTELRIRTDRSRLSVTGCLESQEAKRLFGTISKAPVGNPLTGRYSRRRDVLYFTAEGHLIIVHAEPDATTLSLKPSGPITQGQMSFLRGCSDSLAMW